MAKTDSGTGPCNKELSALEAEAAGQSSATPPGEAPKVDPASVELYAQLWSSIFMLGAKRLGPHWELSRGESQHLGTLTAPVADKYLKGALNSPEAVLLVAVTFMVVPRLAVSSAIKPMAPEKTAQ